MIGTISSIDGIVLLILYFLKKYTQIVLNNHKKIFMFIILTFFEQNDNIIKCFKIKDLFKTF